MPDLPSGQCVEPARRLAPRGGELGDVDLVDRALDRTPSGLRLRPLGRRADRHPLRRRLEDDAALARLLRLRRRVRQGPVPDPEDGAHRRRPLVERRPARDPRRQERLQALRAVRPLSEERRRLEGRLGRDLEPPLERAPSRGLDVGRRRGAADLPRARALRRGRARRHRPCAALHGRADAQGVRLSGPALRVRLERSVAAADGAARPAEGERRHLRLPARRRASCSRR